MPSVQYPLPSNKKNEAIDNMIMGNTTMGAFDHIVDPKAHHCPPRQGAEHSNI